MATQFTTQTATFDSNGTQQLSASFDSTVLGATVVLQGFYATYGNGNYNTSTNQAAISNVSFSGNTVSYDVTFTFDDTVNQRTGNITAAIIAETA